MDYISKSKILLVGTNCHEKTEHDEELTMNQNFGQKAQSILTVNIDHLLDQRINDTSFSQPIDLEGPMPQNLVDLGQKGFTVEDLIN